VFIELPKFKADTATAKKVRLLWLRFLQEIGGEIEPPAELTDYPPIQQALTISQEAAYSRAELLAYQDVLDAIRTETAYVGEKVTEAKAKGREEGIRDEKLAIAKNLLAIMDDTAIATITGLTVEDLQKLRNV